MKNLDFKGIPCLKKAFYLNFIENWNSRIEKIGNQMLQKVDKSDFFNPSISNPMISSAVHFRKSPQVKN